MRLEKGSRAYRKSIDFSAQRSSGYNSLKEDGFLNQKTSDKMKHDPIVMPVPFNNQNPYMIESKALPKKDPLVKEYAFPSSLPRVNSQKNIVEPEGLHRRGRGSYDLHAYKNMG